MKSSRKRIRKKPSRDCLHCGVPGIISRRLAQPNSPHTGMATIAYVAFLVYILYLAEWPRDLVREKARIHIYIVLTAKHRDYRLSLTARLSVCLTPRETTYPLAISFCAAVMLCSVVLEKSRKELWSLVNKKNRSSRARKISLCTIYQFDGFILLMQEG